MPIPALIVSGYLGSGKTTLVGQLLKHAQAEGVRLAIISNEFGDTGIDRALLDAGQDGFVELDGGCVCCRLSDALGETLEMLLTTVKPDRLVLETSGVALPGEILVQFWRPPIDDLISEEVVVVLVDADRLARDEPMDDTFIDQIEAADLLLLTKVDLVDDASRQAGIARLTEMSQGQPVLPVSYGDIEPALLFPPDPQSSRTTRRDADAPTHPHQHERFSTNELAFEGVVEEAEVLRQVAAHDTLRAKGFVRTPAGVRVVQGVGARIEIVAPTTPIPDDLVGKVVLIRRETGTDAH